MCQFHEITGFILTVLEKVPRTQNFEKKLQESGLFAQANLFLRSALEQTRRIKWVCPFVARNHPLTGAVTSCRHFGCMGGHTATHCSILQCSWGLRVHESTWAEIWKFEQVFFHSKLKFRVLTSYDSGNSVTNFFHHQASGMTKERGIESAHLNKSGHICEWATQSQSWLILLLILRKK